MYAIIDTETSGLFDFSKPADAEGQPRLAHLHMILADVDLNIEDRYDRLIKPDGWTMSPEVAAINGLTQERLEAEGVPVGRVLERYSVTIPNRILVAHNCQYDSKIMRGELRRAGLPDLFEQTQNICTMRAATGVCRIPAKNGRGYKFPKLGEAMSHFNIPFEGEHEAGADAYACYQLFRRMRELGIKMEPAVHYAKNRPEREPVLPIDQPALNEGQR